jgi:hypothetical protein
MSERKHKLSKKETLDIVKYAFEAKYIYDLLNNLSVIKDLDEGLFMGKWVEYKLSINNKEVKTE